MTKRQRAQKRAEYCLAQLKKPTAWRGVALILTSLGIAVSPEEAEAITAAGMCIAGFIGWLAPPDPEDPKDPEDPE